MVADPEWKIYRSCREICDGRTRRDLLEIQIQIQNGRYEEIWGDAREIQGNREWDIQGRYKKITNEKFNGDTGRSKGNPEEKQGDPKWEIQGDLEEIWGDPGEIQGNR
jgi:hypothetical protein